MHALILDYCAAAIPARPLLALRGRLSAYDPEGAGRGARAIHIFTIFESGPRGFSKTRESFLVSSFRGFSFLTTIVANR